MLKRLFDIIASLIGAILLSPLLLFIAITVRATSPGPAFYRGVRTGRHGRPFRIFKFRTMVVNAEQSGGTTTGQNDPRVTTWGAFLRKYKLDELPQLFNVLLGDMSLVGPRPEVPEYTALFTERERHILDVRPGITDLSSLHFHDLQLHVGSEDPDRVFREQILPQKNAMRLKYVEQRSFLGDVAILLQTLWVLAARLWRRRTHAAR
jgi:lipopolysaccharide/colanic/teichoic acid biosynthesis glycosyltransferase